MRSVIFAVHDASNDGLNFISATMWQKFSRFFLITNFVNSLNRGPVQTLCFLAVQSLFTSASDAKPVRNLIAVLFIHLIVPCAKI